MSDSPVLKVGSGAGEDGEEGSSGGGWGCGWEVEKRGCTWVPHTQWQLLPSPAPVPAAVPERTRALGSAVAGTGRRGQK